jgi:hypothetical protein
LFSAQALHTLSTLHPPKQDASQHCVVLPALQPAVPQLAGQVALDQYVVWDVVVVDVTVVDVTDLQDENGVLVSSLPSPQSLSAQRSGKRRYWFKNGKNSQ